MKAFFQRVPLRELFRVKIISDGFNLILPSASLGGDAMRAFLIKEQVPLSVGVPGVLFDKTIEFIASIIFLGSGLLLGLLALRLPVSLIVPAVVSLAITSTGIALLVVLQKGGLTRGLLKASAPLPAAHRWVLKRESTFLAMDESLGPLYSRSNHQALPPIVFHVLSRCVGVVEIMTILAVLGTPASFVQALFIATMVTSANTAFFMFPGQWGVTESAHVLVLQSMGSGRRRPQPGPDPENPKAHVRRPGAAPAGTEETFDPMTRRFWRDGCLTGVARGPRITLP